MLRHVAKGFLTAVRLRKPADAHSYLDLCNRLLSLQTFHTWESYFSGLAIWRSTCISTVRQGHIHGGRRTQKVDTHPSSTSVNHTKAAT